MKVIPPTCHSHYISYLRFYFYFTMIVPDEGYSTNTSFVLHYISSFLFVFYYKLTWWRLFHKHVIRTTLYIFVSIWILLWTYLMKIIPQTRHSHTILDIFVSIFILLWTYLMKVIPQTCYSHYIIYLRFYFYSTVNVPDEGYSTNTLFTLHYISSVLFLFYYERTWLRLFQKHVIHTTLAIFVSIFILQWAYLMKAIPQTRHSHYIIYLRFYFYSTMNLPDEGYSRKTYIRCYFISEHFPLCHNDQIY
jgi:hypothetical protein